MGYVETTFRKPTAANSLLTWKSFHPTPLRRGIPVGQYLRARRNCSTMVEFDKEAKVLYNRFRERGYPKKILSQAYKKSLERDRSSLLINKQKEGCEGPIRIIGTYDVAATKIRHILNTHWPILKDDTHIRDCIEDYPSIVYRKGRSLHDRLVSSHYVAPRREGTWLDRQIKGSYKCSTCKACQYMLNTKTFCSPNTGTTYHIKDFCNCKSTGVVYIGICGCPLVYVGKTLRELHRHVLEHIGDILHSRDTAIARHMRSRHSKDPFGIKFCGIKLIRPNVRRGDLDRLLLQKEAGWIYRLKTVDPGGMNESLLFTSFI